MLRGISLFALGLVIDNLIQSDKRARMKFNGVSQYSSFNRYQTRMIIGFLVRLLGLGMLLGGLFQMARSLFF
ncbi:hypothetical protein [Fibrella aquatica]|uniref:hypothetical protein n=1 Tax=Fibrella aquatica TaxID=3242487 RepID=UPI0035205CD7